LKIAVKYKDRIDESLIMPRVNWRHTRNDHRHVPRTVEKTTRAARPAPVASHRRMQHTKT
jgi:hypothetical protein